MSVLEAENMIAKVQSVFPHAVGVPQDICSPHLTLVSIVRSHIGVFLPSRLPVSDLESWSDPRNSADRTVSPVCTT